jgi:hypothetical protein
VYDVAANPSFYALEGDIIESVDLIPVTYRARLKDSPAPARAAELRPRPDPD